MRTICSKDPHRCVSRGTRVGSRRRWRCRGSGTIEVWRLVTGVTPEVYVNPVAWHEGISFQFDNLRIWIQKWIVWSHACWICSLDQWLEGHSSLFSTGWFETYWCEPTNGRWWDVFQRMTPKTYDRQISGWKLSGKKTVFLSPEKSWRVSKIHSKQQFAAWHPWKIMVEIVHPFGDSICLGRRVRLFLFGVVFQASGDWLEEECSHHDPRRGWQP